MLCIAGFQKDTYGIDIPNVFVIYTFRHISYTILLISCSGFQVSAIVLISTSTDISLVKPCDLEKALDSLGLGVTSPCTYNVTKDRSTSLCGWGIGVLVVNFIFFIMILYFKLMSKKWKWVLFFVVSTTFNRKNLTVSFSIIFLNTLYIMTKCIYVLSMLLLQSFLLA